MVGCGWGVMAREKNNLPYIQDASGLQKMKCTYDEI
jgi:hypothetical protein